MMLSMNFLEITVQELSDQLDQFQLVDVREAHELEISKLENVIHIPLGELESRLDEIDSNKPTVVICRSGGRSAKGAEILTDNGVDEAYNLVGGMNKWAMDIDLSMEIY